MPIAKFEWDPVDISDLFYTAFEAVQYDGPKSLVSLALHFWIVSRQSGLEPSSLIYLPDSTIHKNMSHRKVLLLALKAQSSRNICTTGKRPKTFTDIQKELVFSLSFDLFFPPNAILAKKLKLSSFKQGETRGWGKKNPGFFHQAPIYVTPKISHTRPGIPIEIFRCPASLVFGAILVTR